MSAAIKKLKFLIFIFLAPISLSGCAYSKFYKKYEVRGDYQTVEVSALAAFLESYFHGQGLALKRKYSKVFPSNVHYLVFEIPRASGEKRLDPNIIISVFSSKHISIEQSEWYLSSFNGGNAPKDYLASVVKELENQMALKFGTNVQILLLSKE